MQYSGKTDFTVGNWTTCKKRNRKPTAAILHKPPITQYLLFSAAKWSGGAKQVEDLLLYFKAAKIACEKSKDQHGVKNNRLASFFLFLNLMSTTF